MATESSKIDWKYNTKVFSGLVSKYKGNFLIMLVLSFLIQVTWIVDKWIFKIIIDRGSEFINQGLTIELFLQILVQLLIIYMVLLVSRPLMKWILLHLNTRLATNIMNDLKRKLFNHIIRLSYEFHSTHKTGSLISRLIRGSWAVDALNDVVQFNMMPFFFQATVTAAALWYFSWVPALMVVLTCIAFIIYSVFIQRISEPHSIAANDEEDIEKAYVSDFF